MYKLTIKEYLENPAGKGSTIFGGNLTQQKEEYKRKLQAVEAIGIKYGWYKVKDKFLYCHLLIPSVSFNSHKLYYDVVLEFNVAANDQFNGNLKESPMRVFSNMPSFVFTFAYTFNKNNLLIPWLKDKYPSAVFNSDSEVRNPYHIITFEKSLYLSLLYLSANRLSYGTVMALATEIKDFSSLKLKVQSSDAVLNKYNMYKAREMAAKRRKEKEEKRKREAEIKRNSQKTSKNTTKTSKTVKKSSTVKNVKKTKTVGKTKSVKTI